jgi:hypothetical protein
MLFLPAVANMDPSRKLLRHKLPSSLPRFSYSSASLLAVIPMRSCALTSEPSMRCSRSFAPAHSWSTPSAVAQV